LNEDTPDHTGFSRARKKIGTDLLSKIFEHFRDQLKTQGYMNEVFTFVDASHLIAKASLWEEWDEALKQKYEKLNNEVLPKVAHDKQARIGCKGKNKFWYGYKKHVRFHPVLVKSPPVCHPFGSNMKTGWKRGCQRELVTKVSLKISLRLLWKLFALT
jgi:hypothetical protein